MSQKSHLIFAFVAGLVGSGIMHYVAPTLAFAQDQTPVAKEVRAQSFTLVDPSNKRYWNIHFRTSAWRLFSVSWRARARISGECTFAYRIA